MVRFLAGEGDGELASLWGLTERTLEHAFLHEPFYRPYRYSEVRYAGPGRKINVKHKRTEGLGTGRN